MNWGLVTDRYTVGLISDISSMMETACGGEGERDSVFFFTTLEIFYGNERRSASVCTGCNASEDIKPNVK